jgi:phosphomannomutase
MFNVIENLTCFKAYDVRGQLGEELNEEIAYRIGRAFGQHLQCKTVVVGGDVRETSAPLKDAAARGLMDAGVNVLDLGLCGTEEIYYATKDLKTDGGIMVTASHNPINYNGMKMVIEGSRPLGLDNGMAEIKAMAEAGVYVDAAAKGTTESISNVEPYLAHLMTYMDTSKLRPLKIVMNPGNGAACPTLDRIEEKFKALNLPIEFIKMFNEPDGTFPNGIPNPILREQQPVTANMVLETGADLGIAWDGDFDRCFMFDEKGQFIEGYYIVGLLAQAFLKQDSTSRIVYDPRLTWNTVELVEEMGGTPVMCQSGHSFIKNKMRAEDAVYGGEMSAHHYFRDFAYCDSGMIPWILVIDLLSREGKSLSDLVGSRMDKFPSPGEINSKVEDATVTIAKVRAAYEGDAISIDTTDGVSIEFSDWRFNLRMSNTEPVIRFNIETRGDKALMDQKTEELLAVIRA